MPSFAPDCAEVVIARAECADLLTRLTTGQSVAVRLSSMGYTHAEIGDMLGISRQAVSSRIARARGRLLRFSANRCQNDPILRKCYNRGA